MAELFDMGGFGGFIWTSYSFAFICLSWLNYASWRKVKNTSEQLATLQAATSANPKNTKKKNSD